MNYGDTIEICGKEYTIVNDGLSILVKKKEPTYKAGDVFQVVKSGVIYILSQTDKYSFCLINLTNGNRRSDPVEMGKHEFTLDEINKYFICYSSVKPIGRECVFRSSHNG